MLAESQMWNKSETLWRYIAKLTVTILTILMTIRSSTGVVIVAIAWEKIAEILSFSLWWTPVSLAKRQGIPPAKRKWEAIGTYLYPAGIWGNCDPALGDVYVLDVPFETGSYNAKKPGFKCAAGSNGTTSWGGLDWTGWGWGQAQNG